MKGFEQGILNGDGAIGHSATPSDATPVSNAVMNHENNYTGYINVLIQSVRSELRWRDLL